jgi:hypothetical protein
VKITYLVLVFPGLKLETTLLSKLWQLANDWLCERSPEMISYLVMVRYKNRGLFRPDFNQIELILPSLTDSDIYSGTCTFCRPWHLIRSRSVMLKQILLLFLIVFVWFYGTPTQFRSYVSLKQERWFWLTPGVINLKQHQWSKSLWPLVLIDA